MTTYSAHINLLKDTAKPKENNFLDKGAGHGINSAIHRHYTQRQHHQILDQNCEYWPEHILWQTGKAHYLRSPASLSPWKKHGSSLVC
jgi:hypothetical protein